MVFFAFPVKSDTSWMRPLAAISAVSIGSLGYLFTPVATAIIGQVGGIGKFLEQLFVMFGLVVFCGIAVVIFLWKQRR